MRSKKILIADDEAPYVMSLRFLLENEGYEVIEAVDGEEALEEARNRNPDLMILDIRMPPSGSEAGIEICRQLKKDEKTRSLPIIIVSVKGSTLDKQKAKSAGASDYLPKPFNSNVLLRMIKNYLQ